MYICVRAPRAYVRTYVHTRGYCTDICRRVMHTHINIRVCIYIYLYIDIYIRNYIWPFFYNSHKFVSSNKSTNLNIINISSFLSSDHYKIVFVILVI